MGNIGLPELLIVLVIALVVFGPKRLPQMGRQLGQALHEFRSATTDIRSQIGIDDITDSVKDIKSGLSLTGDTTPATQPAAPAAPQSVAPAAVTAAVTAAAAASAPPIDDAAVEPAPSGREATSTVLGEPAAVEPTVVADPAIADPATPAMPDAPSAPSAPTSQGPGAAVADAPTPDKQAEATGAPVASDGAGVETFGKLRRSTTPAAASTTAD